MRPNSGDAKSEEKDIAKYFVPASTIRTFIPSEYRIDRHRELFDQDSILAHRQFDREGR